MFSFLRRSVLCRSSKGLHSDEEMAREVGSMGGPRGMEKEGHKVEQQTLHN